MNTSISNGHSFYRNGEHGHEQDNQHFWTDTNIMQDSQYHQPHLYSQDHQSMSNDSSKPFNPQHLGSAYKPPSGNIDYSVETRGFVSNDAEEELLQNLLGSITWDQGATNNSQVQPCSPEESLQTGYNAPSHESFGLQYPGNSHDSLLSDKRNCVGTQSSMSNDSVGEFRDLIDILNGDHEVVRSEPQAEHFVTPHEGPTVLPSTNNATTYMDSNDSFNQQFFSNSYEPLVPSNDYCAETQSLTSNDTVGEFRDLIDAITWEHEVRNEFETEQFATPHAEPVAVHTESRNQELPLDSSELFSLEYLNHSYKPSSDTCVETQSSTLNDNLEEIQDLVDHITWSQDSSVEPIATPHEEPIPAQAQGENLAPFNEIQFSIQLLGNSASNRDYSEGHSNNYEQSAVESSSEKLSKNGKSSSQTNNICDFINTFCTNIQSDYELGANSSEEGTKKKRKKRIFRNRKTETRKRALPTDEVPHAIKNENNEFVCVYENCGFKTKWRSNVMQHVQSNHYVNYVICCHLLFPTKCHWDLHKFSVHGDGMYQCTVLNCDRKFARKVSIPPHESDFHTQDEISRLKCSVCRVVLPSPKNNKNDVAIRDHAKLHSITLL